MIVEKLRRIVKNDYGAAILSALIGFGLAAFFQKSCEGDVCEVYYSPDRNSLQDKTAKFDNDCYKYVPKDVSCKNKDNKKIIEPKPKDIKV
jgi:hypothetical protein